MSAATGAAVLRYDGKRGTTWTIRYLDADGKLARERLGTSSEGWNRRKAKAELRARVVAVQRDHFRKPPELTFASFADGWVDRHCDRGGLKRSTRDSYRLIVDASLVPAFGSLRLDEITVAKLEGWMAARRKAGVAAATLQRHLGCLSLLLDEARRQDLLRENPLPLVRRPRAPRRRWRILSPPELRAVEGAFRELIGEAEGDEERRWREQCRVVFLVAADSGCRRGELLGLKWRSVALADPAGPRIRVEETIVKGYVDTPKSVAGERTIEISDLIAAELFEHRSRSAFQGEDEHVFVSSWGTPFDVARYATTFGLVLARAGVEGRVRPFHDLRHSSITNGAAAGMSPAALQKRAGHSAYSTTQGYIDLAGVSFAEEAAKLAARLWGSGTKFQYEVAASAGGDHGLEG
jgi:integrase